MKQYTKCKCLKTVANSPSIIYGTIYERRDHIKWRYSVGPKGDMQYCWDCYRKLGVNDG